MKLPNYIKALNVNVVFIVLAFFCYKGVTAYNYHNSYEYKLKKYNDCLRMLEQETLGDKGSFVGAGIYEKLKTEINSGYNELKKYIHPRDLAILCMRFRTDAIDSMSGNERSKEKDALFFPSEQIELTK